MSRLLAVLVLMASSVYGAGVCLCPPSIIAIINGTNYSNSFLVTALPDNAGYSITGGVQNDIFSFSLNVATQPDPDIDFGMSIAGDPDVSIVITQTFLGGPFPNFTGTSSGVITDANLDGIASLTGIPGTSSFIVTTFVNGVLTDQQDTGCNLTGTPGFTSPCPVSAASQAFLLGSQAVGNSAIAHGTLELDLNLRLSEGDAATVNGSINIAAAAVPEPATGALLATGFLGLAGFFWRRRKQ